MNNIIGHKISSSRFSYNAERKEFCAEISEIQHGGSNPLGPLYHDAADAGFVMISAKTGDAVQFYLSDEQRDADRDVKFWEFKPTEYSIRKNPALAGVTVIILND